MASNLDGESIGAGIGVYWWDSATRKVSRGSGIVSTAADPSISGDGNLIAFAANGIGGAIRQIYLKNIGTGELKLVSQDGAGVPGNADSAMPAISRDGSTIVFVTSATNLAPGCVGTAAAVVAVDVADGTLACITRGLDWASPNASSSWPTMSADGRVIAFSSSADNLVSGDTNRVADVFLYDREERRMVLLSRPEEGASNGDSIQPSISDDGRLVAYLSSATNLAPGDTNGADDVFLWDAADGRTSPVTWVDGHSANSFSAQPRISGDGRFVVFLSPARNLVEGQNNSRRKIYRWDRVSRRFDVISVGFNGEQAAGDSFQPAISSDGSTIAFRSNAPNIIEPDRNFTDDVFVVGGLPTH